MRHRSPARPAGPVEDRTVLVKEGPARPGGRRLSLLDQARVWAVLLEEEFGVPFAFYRPGEDGSAPALAWPPEGDPAASASGAAG